MMQTGGVDPRRDYGIKHVYSGVNRVTSPDGLERIEPAWSFTCVTKSEHAVVDCMRRAAERASRCTVVSVLRTAGARFSVKKKMDKRRQRLG